MSTDTPPVEAGTTTPAPPGPRSRAAAVIEILLVSGFPTQLAVGALLLAAGVGPWDSTGTLSLRYLVSVLVIDAILVVAIMLVALRGHGESATGLFFGRRVQDRDVWLGIALVPAVVLGTAGLMQVLRLAWPALHNVPTNPFEALIRSKADAAILGAAAVVGGGIKEELQRAFILDRFDRYLGGAVPGLVLYSLAFGAGHALQGWDVGVMTALLGVVWGAVYLWRRSTVAPMVSHAGFNTAQIIQFVLFGS